MSAGVHDCSVATRVMMRCWGDFALTGADGGADLRPRGRKARALLAYMAMHADKAVSRERLMGLLWGERAEAQARSSLRQSLQELKRLANGFGVITIMRDSVMLNAAALETDLDLMRGAAARQSWQELIDLLPEPHERLFANLEGLDSGFDDWLAIERARQEEAADRLISNAQLQAQRSGAQREARLLAIRLSERDPDAVLASRSEEPPPNASPGLSSSPASVYAVRPSQRRRHAVVGSVALLACVGAIVLGALSQRAPPALDRPSPMATSGSVHNLYLRARAKIRERNPEATEEARGLLDHALALDPNFAPLWSSLAQVTLFEANAAGPSGEQIRKEASSRARRALELAPDLAEANAVMALVLGFEGEAGRRHIQKATELDPGNQEYRFWLGHAYSDAFDYPRALAAYRSALEIDPTWWPVVSRVAELAWSMGRREEATNYVRRVEREVSSYHARLLSGLLASRGGDLSGAADAFEEAQGRTDDLGKQAVAAYNRAAILFALGYVEAAQRERASYRPRLAKGHSLALAMPERFAGHLALSRGTLPSAAALAELNGAGNDRRTRAFVRDVTGRMIVTGRAREAAALYDGPNGLLGFSKARPVPASTADLIVFAPTVAAVLAASGREEEARRLLVEADQQIKLALRRSNGEVDAAFWGAAAATWALLGKGGAALDALERAVSNGWLNADLVAEDLPSDLAKEPVFASLRGHPRFVAVRAEINGRLARERAEIRPNIG